jgi:hypothetical protein
MPAREREDGSEWQRAREVHAFWSGRHCWCVRAALRWVVSARRALKCVCSGRDAWR